jgi:23S rRNA (cytosine1962-C5)-methyltransferase
MLSYSADAVPDSEYMKSLVSAAIERRASADGVSPLAAANRGVRLVHGESDGLPGVVADSYDGWCVVQFASAGAERFRDEVVAALMEAGAKGVFNRSDVDSRKREGLSDDGTVGVLADLWIYL